MAALLGAQEVPRPADLNVPQRQRKPRSWSAGELPLAEATVSLDLHGNGQLDPNPAAGSPFAYLGFESTGPSAIGIRTLIDNPNQPNHGPLERPFTATSEIEVSGLPGVVTDLGMLFSLRSD